MIRASHIWILTLLFCFFTPVFAQEVKIEKLTEIKLKEGSETARMESPLCFDRENEKPKLRPIRKVQKRNGPKVFYSDCCPVQVSALESPSIIYPPAAKAVGAAGNVSVEVFVDEEGKVFWAEVVEGHPLLHAAALRAACGTIFKPYVCNCGKRRAEQFRTIINYNFSIE